MDVDLLALSGSKNGRVPGFWWPFPNNAFNTINYEINQNDNVGNRGGYYANGSLYAFKPRGEVS